MAAAQARRRARVRNRATKRPPTMRAAALDRFGGPEVLKVRLLPVPEIDPSEVLIAVHTAGVGSWDGDMREGWWPDSNRPAPPLVLGTDGSGTIAAVGSRVRRFAPGDIVYAYSFANPKGGSTQNTLR
jgi:NADPH:quinone reductase